MIDPRDRATNVHGRGLWPRWVAMTFAGEVVGFGVVSLVGALVAITIGERTGAAAQALGVAAMVGGGAIEGLALGFAQSRVLRSWIPALSGRKWIVVTMVGAAAAWLVGMTASVVAPEPKGTVAASLVVTVGLVVCAVLGAILGLSQWTVLRRHVDHAGRWIVATSLAWTIGMAIILSAMAALPAGAGVAAITATGVLAGGLAGLSVGAITGAALLLLTDPAHTLTGRDRSHAAPA